MRGRTSLLILSLFGNAILALALVITARKSAPKQTATTEPATNQLQRETKLRTAVVVRNQLFDWSQLESPDYPTYIANLRAVNCPEQTIRDIIVADVNQVFAQKRDELWKACRQGKGDMQWWKREPYEDHDEAFYVQDRALRTECRATLNKLLGSGWDRGKFERNASLCFDGPVLAALSPETKQLVEQVMTRLKESNREGYSKLQDLSEPSTELRQSIRVQMRQQRKSARAEIAALLTPEQFEEYELRNSSTASGLRSELPDGFEVTPDEFRKLYRSKVETDSKLEDITDYEGPDSERQQAEIEAQQETAMRSVLGDQRYAEFKKLQDSDYQQAKEIAQEYQAASGIVETLYELNRAAVAEHARLDANTNLTDLQRAIETKKIELAHLQAQARALGQATEAAAPQENVPDATSQPFPTPRYHTIRSGETLGSLSAAYGIPVNALLDANPGLQINSLRPGQQIVIPPSQSIGR